MVQTRRNGVLYATNVHKTGGRYRILKRAARRFVTAFLEDQAQQVLNALRTDAPRKTIGLRDVFAAIRSCNSLDVAEQLISDMKAAQIYPEILKMAQRQQKKNKAAAETAAS